MINKIYVWLLWVFGAALTDEELEELKGKGDRITYWFRRSKKRIGFWWWVLLSIDVALIVFHLGLWCDVW